MSKIFSIPSKGEFIIKILSILLIAALLLPSSNHHADASEIPSKVSAALKQLDTYSGGTLEIDWNSETNTPTRLTGKLTQPSKHSPEWIAFEFLDKWRVIYGLQKPKLTMKVVGVEQYDDRIAVHLRHQLFQTPVWEDKLVIEINKEGVIEQIVGTIHPHLEKKMLNRPMHPAISEKQAIQKAKSAKVHGELMSDPKVECYYLSTRPGTPLIYVVTLESFPDQRTITLIHSLTGTIIE